MNLLINFSYLLAASLFVIGLKFMNSPNKARSGNLLSALGMFIAVVVTLLHKDILDYKWIMVSILIGSAIGLYLSQRVPMTAMPEMVALLNGFGGLSSLLVGWSVYHVRPNPSLLVAVTIYLSILVGGVTFTGSLIAWAKLSEKIAGRPFLFFGQKTLNFLCLSLLLLGGIIYSMNPSIHYPLLLGIIAGSLFLGILVVIPIGGADMPVVISLLNSYSGIAASAAGFVIQNNVLIVSGALVGASGIILTSIMCKAMNRSLSNVLFSGFGSVKEETEKGGHGEVKSITPKDAYYVLESAKSVLVVPGYGLAVAQAQHLIRELCELLEKKGAHIKYAIHSVAGRMPGHMNVLLAEAGIPYDQLVEMDDVNPGMENVDLCLVVGANDVVNPSARDNPKSSIYGMPIIEVDRAKNVFILKRSMNSGFAGIENPLFFKENACMIFGDAKHTLQALVSEMKD